MAEQDDISLGFQLLKMGIDANFIINVCNGDTARAQLLLQYFLPGLIEVLRSKFLHQSISFFEPERAFEDSTSQSLYMHSFRKGAEPCIMISTNEKLYSQLTPSYLDGVIYSGYESFSQCQYLDLSFFKSTSQMLQMQSRNTDESLLQEFICVFANSFILAYESAIGPSQ